MTGFRRRLLLSGLAGLLADAALGGVAAWLIVGDVVQAPLPHPLVILLSTAVLGSLSLAEIPMMVLAIRHLAAEKSNNQTLALGLNAVFVFFAAIYGAPVLLITGSLVWGLALCALGLIRLAASLLFVREPSPP